MDKLIRDGKVAVLISPGFGAGWSTWNHHIPEILWDPTIVQMLEEGCRPQVLHQYVEDVYPDVNAFGTASLRVVWIPEGTRFRVTEYDGHESIVLHDEENWHVA